MPPKANSSIASTCAVRDGSLQGSLANQASNPRPPRARAPLSREATTLKNVSRLGKKTANVKKACVSFQPCPMPGSVNWWCRPTGVDRSRNRMNDPRAMGSLNSLPPACRGTRVYQETYVGSSQKYTIGCPVNQNRVRARRGSVPRCQPSDHGMSITSISAASPRDAMLHMANVIKVMNAAKGVRSAGMRRPPSTIGPDEIQGAQPGPGHDQREPDVEGPMGLQGWIKRKHDRGRIAQEWHSRHDEATRHQAVRRPGQGAARQRD